MAEEKKRTNATHEKRKGQRLSITCKSGKAQNVDLDVPALTAPTSSKDMALWLM